jgi:hypothetical protein
LDSNREPIFDDQNFFNAYVKKMPIGMNITSIFYEIPYWEHLKIYHLLDPMHRFINVTSSSLRYISSKKSDTLGVRRDLISSNTKKKKWLRKKSRGEVGPSWSFKEGDVPWILKKYKFSLVKDVILGVKVPSLYKLVV